MNSMAKNVKEPKKKKKKKVNVILILLLIIVIAVAIIALLLHFRGGSGFGFGSGGAVPAAGTAAETMPTLPAATSASDTGEIVITIYDDAITVNGSSMKDSEALKEHLLSVNTDGVTYILRDSHAVKSVYDDAKAVLDSLGYEYSEEVE